MSLEARYRRFSRLFPAEWRARHEDEMVATLLDGAEPGQETVPMADAADLVRSAAVVRFRAWVGRDAGRTLARLLSLAGSAAGTALLMVLLIRSWTSDVSIDFLVTSLVVVLVPGTGVVYTVSCAISDGLRRGLVAAVGCTLGIVPHLLAAVLGLSGIMQAGAVAFEAVRWAGVVYLVVMGLAMIRDRGVLQFDLERSPSEVAAGAVIRRGILLNLLNPKLTLFFFAFLPQFLDSPPGLLDPRLVGLGMVFMLLTLVVFAVYAWTSAAVRDRVLRAPGVLRWAQRSLGALVIGFAARLAVTDR